MNPFNSAKEAYHANKKKRAEEKAAKELAKAQASVRKPDVIQQEYARLCGILGDKYYRAECLKAETQQLCEQILKINQEFNKSNAVYKDVPLVEAPQVQAEQKNVEVTDGAQSEAAH